LAKISGEILYELLRYAYHNGLFDGKKHDQIVEAFVEARDMLLEEGKHLADVELRYIAEVPNGG